ncbi:hypothetical protein GOBAR_DD36323 [Gossypium barbadense]|nr:hypothetical protein GOBAR_DD36323 [Gossypium barbadense]
MAKFPLPKLPLFQKAAEFLNVKVCEHDAALIEATRYEVAGAWGTEDRVYGDDLKSIRSHSSLPVLRRDKGWAVGGSSDEMYRYLTAVKYK